MDDWRRVAVQIDQSPTCPLQHSAQNAHRPGQGFLLLCKEVRKLNKLAGYKSEHIIYKKPKACGG